MSELPFAATTPVSVARVGLKARNAAALADLRDALTEALEKAHYPVAEIEVVARADDAVEIVATLVANTVRAKELDAVIGELERLPGVRHVTWDASTSND